MDFTEATTVVPDGGRYAAAVAEGWDILGNANGGYLLAMAARAMADAAGRPDPVTITAHYLAPGRPGPVTIDPVVVKEGRTFTTVRASLASPERPLLELVGTFGDVADRDGMPERVDGGPPDLPSRQDCTPRDAPGEAPAFMSKVELLLHPDDRGFATGAKSGLPRMRGWFGWPDGSDVDTFGLLVAADAFPPTIFNTHLPVGWTPTVELTVHVRGRPAPGPLACSFTTRFVTGGFLEEDGEVWDATGRLVAQSRQLALLPRG